MLLNVGMLLTLAFSSITTVKCGTCCASLQCRSSVTVSDDSVH